MKFTLRYTSAIQTAINEVGMAYKGYSSGIGASPIGKPVSEDSSEAGILRRAASGDVTLTLVHTEEIIAKLVRRERHAEQIALL